MANGEAYGPYRSGLSVVFPNDVGQRVAPLERERQRQFQEEVYDRRLRERQQIENDQFLRELYELNPEVVPPHYQQLLSDRVRSEVIPLGTMAYRGDTPPSQASLQRLHGSINEIRRDENIVNEFYRRSSEVRKAIESDKTGFINKAYANEKLKRLWKNEDGSWKTPGELSESFAELDTFLEDDAMKNVGEMYSKYLDENEKEYFFTRDIPTQFGKYRSQDIKMTYKGDWVMGDDGKPIVRNGNMIPEIDEDSLLKIKHDMPELYEAILFRAEEEGVSPIDFLEELQVLRAGQPVEQILRSTTISPDRTTSPSKYGIPEEDVVRTEGRVDLIHDIVTGVYPAGLKAINGVEYSGDRLSGVITSADVVDKDVYSADYQGPRKKKMFVITYRDDRYPGMPSKTIEIDITTPEGQEEAGQLFNNIMSKELKGTKGQVYPENFRKVWKSKYGTQPTDDPLEIL